jgi:hypothetical protein
MSNLGDYRIDEPAAWTNVSSYDPDWIRRYYQIRPHTDVTVTAPAVDDGLASFSRTFDYDRRHYALFVAHLASLSVAQLANFSVAAVAGSWTLSLASSVISHLPTVSDQPIAPSQSPTPSAASYVSDLLRWMDCTYEDLASITGISRSAFFYWQRTGAAPRASNMRVLLRLHSLIAALVRRLEIRGARAWLDSGQPTPRALLSMREIETVEDLFRDSFMAQPARIERYARRVGGPEYDLKLAPAAASAVPGRASRRPTVGAPKSGD